MNYPYTHRTLIVIAVLANFLSSCIQESEFEKQRNESDLEILNHLNANGIQTRQSERGIHYELLTEAANGEEPKIGEVMKIKYDMKTLAGKQLESQTSELTLLKFGWNYVIPNGVSYGLDIVNKGEKIRFYLPSYLAYSSFGSKDSFDPHTNFIIELELVDTTTEEKIKEEQIKNIEAYLENQEFGQLTPTASGLYYTTLEEGDGQDAEPGHTVKLHYKRMYLDGTVIQETEKDKPLTAQLNSNQLVKGFNEGVLKMKEGEKSLLILPSDLAFGPSVQVIPSTVREELWENGHIASLVRPYAVVIYEVELLEVQ